MPENRQMSPQEEAALDAFDAFIKHVVQGSQEVRPETLEMAEETLLLVNQVIPIYEKVLMLCLCSKHLPLFFARIQEIYPDLQDLSDQLKAVGVKYKMATQEESEKEESYGECFKFMIEAIRPSWTEGKRHFAAKMFRTYVQGELKLTQSNLLGLTKTLEKEYAKRESSRSTQPPD